MKIKISCLTVLLTLFFAAVAFGQDKAATTQNKGWVKYENNPVLRDLGILFDPSVIRTGDGKFQMFCSWYDGQGIGLSESNDGLQWETPVNVLSFGDKAQKYSWEKRLNRPSVFVKDGTYHMWYCAQAVVHNRWYSYIGYATSTDGKNWVKQTDQPVLSPEQPWEGIAVQYPDVLWDEEAQLFKMWYSGGNQFEPDAIGYAESKDGIHWQKRKKPIFTTTANNAWEKAKVASCHVIKREKDYLMIYTGYSSKDHAAIGMARSKDGITGWQRHAGNPVLTPSAEGWDTHALYMPFLLPDKENNRWLLYYNGRHAWNERIGIAIHQGMDLGF